MAVPFLKWAGGKRWFVEYYHELLPKNYNRYIEPFLGSGAVFFDLEPREGIISDINRPLIDTYLAIRENWRAVLGHLKTYATNHSKDYYYLIRENIPRSRYAKAARFIYLNRTCWNGLYRVNKSGMFNVPIGTKTNVILSTDNFEQIANILQRSEIIHSDFEETIDRAREGDFLFIDPPYTVQHNNSFVKYNEKMFCWQDQIRLRNAVIRAINRKVKLILTNANHPSILGLYANFNIHIVTRASVIAASNQNRGKYEEIVVTYP